MADVLFILGLGLDPDFIHFESGSGSRFYLCSPGPDFINGESGSVRIYSGQGPDIGIRTPRPQGSAVAQW